MRFLYQEGEVCIHAFYLKIIYMLFITQAPSWAYISCAIGFFVYQSLDAIDGKQARRTNSNTPMGELFDHGCDAISTFLIVLSAVSTVSMHNSPLIMLGFIVLLMVLAFCYHWQTYVSGVLYFNK